MTISSVNRTWWLILYGGGLFLCGGEPSSHFSCGGGGSQGVCGVQNLCVRVTQIVAIFVCLSKVQPIVRE